MPPYYSNSLNLQTNAHIPLWQKPVQFLFTPPFTETPSTWSTAEHHHHAVKMESFIMLVLEMMTLSAEYKKLIKPGSFSVTFINPHKGRLDSSIALHQTLPKHCCRSTRPACTILEPSFWLPPSELPVPFTVSPCQHCRAFRLERYNQGTA